MAVTNTPKIEKCNNCGMGKYVGCICPWCQPGAPTAPMEPESVCQEADRLVSGARQADYGHPIEDFTRTGRMWGAILKLARDVTPNEVALCMAALKISREVNKHKRDNLVDACGYIKTLDLVVQRQEETRPHE